VILAFAFWVTMAHLQQQPLHTLPPGCTLKTFGVIIPDGWFVTKVQDMPEGREGCLYLRFREDKSAAATIHVESGSATLPLFREKDPFQATYEQIAAGLAKNMNVVLTRESYRNDEVKRAQGSAIDKATMRVFDAEVPGDARPYEVVIAVLRAPRLFFTVIVVTPAEKADREVSEATHEAFRKIMNSITPAGQKQ
jgi:hypothetical protein